MRIIAGKANGRKLKTLQGLSTRPTSDKVKGAIFSVLGDRVADAKVLDLFAGSGALALEALSRGACCAVLVDKSFGACQVIRENCAITGFTSCARVLNKDGEAALRVLEGEIFDLIFIDPPYRLGLSLKSLEFLVRGNYFAPNAVIIVETSREEVLPVEIGNLSLCKQSRYGDTVIRYYQPMETGGN